MDDVKDHLADRRADLSYLIAPHESLDLEGWLEQLGDVIDRYEGRLLSFARRMLAQRSEAEDLVQETFLGLLRSLPNYDKRRSLETYLFAILRHKLSDHFRKHQPGRRQSLESLEVDDAPQAWLSTETPSGHLADDENVAAQRQALVGCLRQYVEQCREQNRFQELMVVEMLMVLGMRNKEVAGDLDLTETAVAGIKFRVLERWRQLTQAADTVHEWQEAELASTSTVARSDRTRKRLPVTVRAAPRNSIETVTTRSNTRRACAAMMHYRRHTREKPTVWRTVQA